MNPITVVSIVPFRISEFKPGLVPNRFEFEPCVDGIPELLVITKVSSMMYIGSDRGSIFIPQVPGEIAQSIVNDYNSTATYVEENAKPGIFWLPGIVTLAEVTKSKELIKARELQKNWFLLQIKVADDEWSKHHQHRVITDPQRYAARHLGLEREWLLDHASVASKKCPACQSFIPSAALVCKSCQTVVDPEGYKKAGLVKVVPA